MSTSVTLKVRPKEEILAEIAEVDKRRIDLLKEYVESSNGTRIDRNFNDSLRPAGISDVLREANLLCFSSGGDAAQVYLKGNADCGLLVVGVSAEIVDSFEVESEDEEDMPKASDPDEGDEDDNEDEEDK